MRWTKPKSQAEREAARLKRRPVDEVLGVPGGASERGSTYYKQLRTCPRAGAFRAAGLARQDGGSKNLDVGLLFHAGLEAYYDAVKLWQDTMPQDKLHKLSAAELVPVRFEAEVWERLRAFESEPGYEATFADVERVLSGYFDAYRGMDAWRILAVEETLEYDDGVCEFTARLDLVVYDYVKGGVWVVEHKTTRAITEAMLSGYQMDFQTLGQCWLIDHCVDLSDLGPFQGVCVNIISKAKTPKVARVEVCPSRRHLAVFEQSLAAQRAVAEYARTLGDPLWLGNCSGPAQYFGTCDYFDLCHGQPGLSVAEILAGDPPFGFKLKGGEE